MNKYSRIGIFGLKSDNSLEQFYLDAFQKLKFKNIKFLSNNFLFKIFCILNKYKLFFFLKIFYFFQKKKIENFLNKNDIEILFIFKGIELNSSIFNIFREKKINLINIYTDDPFNFSSSATSSINVINNIRNFNLFCIWSKNLKNKLENKFKTKNFYYLPFGFSKKKHKALSNKIIRKKISFVGSFDEFRLNILSQLKNRIDIYGNAWPTNIKHQISKFVKNQKFSTIINKSEISLNILKKQNLNSHNMRTFEIPAMNGLMLTTRSKEQNKYFPENKACYMYGNIKELNYKINFILNNPKAALKVRKTGYKLSKKHSYENRLKILINYINKNAKVFNFR
tara:strand:+ start:1163 stop:2179 length:1017 start_codon:yes stop_codon:yes gene_type:complete